MGWFQIIKTEWDFKLKPNYKEYKWPEDRKPRGEYFRDEDKVEINLLENLPSNWSSWKDGKKVVDYDKEPHEKTEWGGKLRGDLDRDTISNVLDVIIHEAGHAGIDRFLEEEGFPEDEKDEFINKWQKQAKLQVWSEIMAELNEHGGDLPQAIDSATLDNAGTTDWEVKTFKPTVLADANNKYSFQLKFDGTAAADFEINDITIIYRMKAVK